MLSFSVSLSAASGKQVKREKQSLGNQVIRKGWIDMPASFLKGGSKEHWFVLSSDNLAWYKDEQVCVFVCAHSCVCACVRAHVCVRVHVCACAHVCACVLCMVCGYGGVVCVCVCVCVCVYVCVCAHMCVCVHIH